MFSSPKPTPRRHPRHPRESVAPRSRPLDYPLTPSIKSSRHSQHPYPSSHRGVSPTSSAGETARTFRDDARGENDIFWGRDARHSVSALGALPGEVQRLIKGVDLLVEPVHGYMDREAGFALVSTPEGCIAWNYTKRTHSPTCHNFPAPPHNLSSPPAVLAALYTATPEPGMILVSPTGEIRFWESMSLASGNVDRHQSLHLELTDEGDLVQRIQKCNANTFIITTNTLLAFQLTIVSSGGRLIPRIVPFTRPSGLFGRATPLIFGGRNVNNRGIGGITSANGFAYLMAKRIVQKWALSSDGAVRFTQEFDLYEAVGGAIFGEEVWLAGGVGLELSDLVAIGNDELAVFVSSTEKQSGSAARSHNSHAIVLFAIHPKANTLMVSRVVNVSYLAHPDPRLIDVPRLYIPLGSAIAFIHFSDVIVVVSLVDASPYEEVITLKDPFNAFLGVGCQSLPSTKIPSAPCLVAMTATGGLMSIEVDNNAGRIIGLSSQASATARLKSKMEQAVFFGDRSDNPLSFDLPAGFQGDAAEAAEAVSAEIIASTSAYMSPISELRPQLSDRLLRLKELITFIRNNGLLSILPQSTRRRLSRDAEKLRAGIDLWDHQNKLMDQIHSHSPQSLLSDSITRYMEPLNVGEEDVVRLFFRRQVQNVDRLLETVFGVCKNAVSKSGKDLTPWVVEANRIFMIVTKAAARFRESEAATYEIDKLHPVEQVWTAQTSLIDAMEYMYHATERLIRDRTREFGSVIDEAPAEGAQRPQQAMQVTLKTQMADLAAALCTNMEEKIRCLVYQMEEGADPQDGLSLEHRWAEMKPKIIRPLITIDKIREAYELAEHHSDFETLVYLCTNPISGMGSGRIQMYIEKFGPEFAFPLYQWYIEQGQFHALLTQDEVYGSLLTEFFKRTNYPQLAWIHHIACKRYGEAGLALLAVEGVSDELAQKHLVASIGKLAAVAEIKTSGSSSVPRKQLLIDLDDELDHVTIQNVLRQTIMDQSTITEASGYRPPPSIPHYVKHHAKSLSHRPTFAAHFQTSAQKLIDGQALGIEDLIDVLTLKDNDGESARDSAVALDRLSRDQALPEGRKQVALLSVWRRVFIRDDWTTLANTTGRSEEAQRQLQRQTLTYHTVKAINDIKDFPRNYVLSPHTSAQPPLSAEIAARFPEKSSSDVELIMRDHENEIDVLQGLLNSGVEERVKEVMELVKRDLGLIGV